MPSLAPANQVTRPQHLKTVVKVKNHCCVLKIEKLNWERERKHVLADGLARREVQLSRSQHG